MRATYSPLRILLGLLLGLALLGALGGAAFVWFGVYNVSALIQHSPPGWWLLQTAKDRSIHQRADDIVVPELDRAAGEKALPQFHQYCRPCHGAPGVAPEPFALGMRPVPTAIASIAGKWRERPAELYWVIVNGVKMTGMPAWRYRLSEEQVWDMVAFIQHLPELPVAEYLALLERAGADEPVDLSGEVLATTQVEAPLPPYGEGEGPVERGRQALQQYGCPSCHRIPGITGAVHDVGPPLRGMADRTLIAGQLPNTRENMVRWLLSPPTVSPLTAMPDLGLQPDDAADIAAYLATLSEVEDQRPTR